jgi:hypothetical protein
MMLYCLPIISEAIQSLQLIQRISNLRINQAINQEENYYHKIHQLLEKDPLQCRSSMAAGQYNRM